VSRFHKDRLKVDAKIFSFNASEPMEGLEVIRSEMKLAHDYYNKLVELERARRSEIEEEQLRRFPELLRIEEEIAVAEDSLVDLVRETKRRNSSRRSAKLPKEDRERIKIARGVLRELCKRRSEMKKGLRENADYQEAEKGITKKAKGAAKEARHESGCFWPNYLQVEVAVESAKKPRKRRKGQRPVRWTYRPRFKRWEGRGRVSMQLQKGLSPERLESGADTRLRLVRGRVTKPGPRRERKQGTAMLWIRVGSTKEPGKRAQPVWAKVPFYYGGKRDRELPPDCSIKWCWLLVDKIGLKERWRVQFSIDAPLGTLKHVDRASDGTVAIDIGWRLMGDRLRCAIWSGSDGEEGEIALTGSWVRAYSRERAMRSYRERLFNCVLKELCSWAKEQEVLPEPLAEARALHAWKKHGKLASLSLKWRGKRDFRERSEKAASYLREGGVVDLSGASEDDVLALLEGWRKRDKHVLEYESHLRDKLQATRLDLYRVCVANLRRRYKTCVLEEDVEDDERTKLMDLVKWHLLPDVIEAGDPGEEEQRRASKRGLRPACLFKLRAILKENMEIVGVPSEFTTKRCWSCGSVEEWDQASEVEHTCENCGETWDQDVNAARNLLVASGVEATFFRPALAPAEVWTCGLRGTFPEPV